jgi:C4-dicarboxylate-specific signal transduction histidine kinase
MTITPIQEANGEITHFIAVKEDITRRKKFKEQLHHVQKMEAIGQLAGGVAHDSTIFSRSFMAIRNWC